LLDAERIIPRLERVYLQVYQDLDCLSLNKNNNSCTRQLRWSIQSNESQS
jgi:hypothetical protein